MDIAALIIKVFFVEFFLPLLAVIGGIAAFRSIETNLISRKVSDRVSKLISDRQTPQGDVNTLADIVVISLGFFDRIFGKHHWTWRCLFISSLFTLLFSVMIFLPLVYSDGSD